MTNTNTAVMDVSSVPPGVAVAVGVKPGFYWIKWSRRWQPALVLEERYALIIGQTHPETLFVLGPALEAPPDVVSVS